MAFLLLVIRGRIMANDDVRRPYPPVNFVGTDNWQPYTRLIPANEVHEWVNRQILIDTGSIHNPDHEHLLEADLCFMWASDSFAKKGRLVLGQAEQVMLRAGCLFKNEYVPEAITRRQSDQE